MSGFTSEYPLNPIVKGWIAKIQKGEQFKYAHFGEQAEEAMKFYECGKELNDLMWSERKGQVHNPDDEAFPAPKFRMVVGKVAEVVQLFGPALYHRNPAIVVEPKTLDLPIDLLMTLVPPEALQQAQMQAQQNGTPFDPQSLFPPDPADGQNKLTATLLNYMLDYLQRENEKYKHSRRMIDEALIKGAGILWTESFQNYDTGPTLIGSFYDTIDNLIVDPDAETIDEALWVARRCTHPVWKFAEDYDLDRDFLDERLGTSESATAQGESTENEEWNKKRKIGKTNDLITYYKVYSKMGMGEKLAGMKGVEEIEDFLDSLGQNAYIVVADKIPFPVNLKQEDVEELFTEPDAEQADQLRETLFQSCQWPIPFWADGQWPMTMLAFHEVPNNPWPMSHIKPALGYLKFLNWTMSFLANRIRTSCRTVAACMKSVEDEVRNRLLSGKDFEILEISSSSIGGGTSPDVSKLVQFLQVPDLSGEIWKVIDAISHYFEQATGLSELAYGTPGGMRSAAEAHAKQGNMNIRPDDMANKVEDTMSLIARKEAMACRWLLEPDSVMPILGQRGTQLWAQLVMSGDVNKVSREYNYRVEAGSTRKPNKETMQDNINQALQTWMPFLQVEVTQKNSVQTVNAFIEQWCKAFDIEPKKFLLPQPPPPPPPPELQKVQAEIQALQQKGQLEQQKMQLDSQLKQQDAQARMQESQTKLQLEIRKMEMEIAAKRAEMELDAQARQEEMQMERQALGADLQAQQLQLGMKLKTEQALGAQKLQMGHLDMQHQALSNKAQLAHDKEAHKAKMTMQKQQAKAKPKGAKK